MMKRILVPIDFSENAIKALSYARVIFETIPCTFYLFNVYISYPSKLLEEEYYAEWVDPGAEAHDKELKKLLLETRRTNQNSKHNFNCSFESNNFVSAISEIVISKHIDYVIMGTNGAKGAKEIFLGSKAVKVIDRIKNCPIIVVPDECQVKGLSQIVFSTNFKRAFKKEELDLLLTLSKIWKAKIKVLQITNVENLDDFQKTNKESLKDIFKGLSFYFHKINVSSSETAAIREFVQTTESDMISLVNHKQNFLQKLTLVNVVKKVSFNSPVPILILPEMD